MTKQELTKIIESAINEKLNQMTQNDYKYIDEKIYEIQKTLIGLSNGYYKKDGFEPFSKHIKAIQSELDEIREIDWKYIG